MTQDPKTQDPTTHDPHLPADATTVYFWGAKGGVGTSTVAAMHAVALARAGYPTTIIGIPPQFADLAGLLAVPPPTDRVLDVNAATACPPAPALRPYVVIDGGTDRGRSHMPSQRYLVIRPCYLALRRAMETGITGTHGIVLVTEAQRCLGQRDVVDVLGLPVVATMDVTPMTARCIDAGLIATRLGSRSPLRWVDAARWATPA